MATEFNFRRAWDEEAGPGYERLPQEFKDFYHTVATKYKDLRQKADLTVDIVPEAEELASKFDGPDLALGMMVIYYWGHWASDGKGPNNRAHAGAYWKVENILKRIINRDYRGQRYEDLIRQKYPDSYWANPSSEERAKRFMDHKEGTEISYEEYPKRYQHLVEEEFELVKGTTVNHRPHPFTIGTQHFPRDGGIYIQPDQAPCAFRSGSSPYNRCQLSYDQHTYEVALFVKLKKNLSNKEAAQALTRIKDAAAADKVRLDGFGFLNFEEFKIAPPEGEQACSESDTGNSSPSSQ